MFWWTLEVTIYILVVAFYVLHKRKAQKNWQRATKVLLETSKNGSADEIRKALKVYEEAWNMLQSKR